MTLDINECLTLNGGCNQTCNNTVGSYFCDCSGGYVLDTDKHNCSGIIEAYFLIFKRVLIYVNRKNVYKCKGYEWQ